MASYFLDTGILLGYVRGAPWAGYVEQQFAPSKPPNLAVTSVVCVAELRALAMANRWGEEKLAQLDAVLRAIPAIAIRHSTILEKFSEIHSYNRRRHPALPPPSSGRTMGDNDMWVAASAAVLHYTLLTNDHDFDHLHGVFLEVIYVDQQMRGKEG
jgi:tRNA(fMet)-specific endonuclease VapC